jgi:hypothetical protein
MEITVMTITPTASKAAIVDKDYHWIDIKVTPPPRGPKMLLIHKSLGVAVLGAWRESDTWTHWCPLPTFERDE